MIRVLIVECNGFLPESGITHVIMNYYIAMDKKGMKVDIAASGTTSKDLKAVIESGGGDYIELPKRRQCILYFYRLKKLLKNYDVIHINGNSATMILELLSANFAGVPKKIVHCHNTRTSHPILNNILSPVFNHMYTHALACSKDAGKWLYKKHSFKVLNNAIAPDKYKFNKTSREKVRSTFNIQNDEIVIGHVGNFNEQKNHEFLVKIFDELHTRDPNYRLLLVGDGKLEKNIKYLLGTKGLLRQTYFVGRVSNPEYYLNAMDVFLFPSYFEGLPLALMEAQVNGLPCIVSDAVSKEANLGGKFEFINLDMPSSYWRDHVMKVEKQRSSFDEVIRLIRNKNYDVTVEAEKLKKLYGE